MRLMFLYVREWGERSIDPLRPISVNLDSEFVFACDGHRVTAEQGRKLPAGFFSVVDREKMDSRRNARNRNIPSKVESVSAIVGVNGSGKTSIAALLGRLFQRGRPSPSYACVLCKGNDLLAYTNIDGLVWSEQLIDMITSAGYRLVRADDDANLPPDCKSLSDIAQYARPVDAIYYSPYLSSQSVWPGGKRAGFADVSTGHYLLPDLLSKADAGGNASSPHSPNDEDRVANFLSADERRVMDFAHNYLHKLGRKNDKDAVLPLPKWFDLKIDFTPFLAMVDEIDVDIERSRRRRENAQLREVGQVLCREHEDNVVWQFLSAMTWVAAHDMPYEKDFGYRDQGIEVLIRLSRRFAKRQEPEAADAEQFDLAFSKEEDAAVRGLGIHPMALLAFMRSLLKIGSKVERQSECTYRGEISQKETFDCALDLLRHSARLGKRYARLVSVKLATMSSGEMAYWTLFARMLDAVDGLKRTRKGNTRFPGDDLLVFLDEAETTLHPDWQQKLVKSVIWFFETFTSGLKVHIIFASHSPMILSDVPKGNVAFLMQDAVTPGGRTLYGRDEMKRDLEGLKNTFGANIYDLYRLSYFLREGTMGAFARMKIDKALKEVADVAQTRQGMSRREGSVGEMPNVGDSSNQVLQEIGDAMLIKYLQNLKEGGLL